MLSFEPLAQTHLRHLSDIYNTYIMDTTVLFFNELMTPERFDEMTLCHSRRFTHFAVVEDGRVVGHAAIKPHSPRSCYDETADVTIILSQYSTGRGAGTATLRFLEEAARENGFHTLIAQISGENSVSVNFFAKNGYTRCGLLKEVGSKFGRYIDVAVFQKIL